MRVNVPRPSQLGLFWLGIQAVWGALLGISLQARSIQLGGAHALSAYGTIATVGALVAAAVQIVVGPLADRRRSQGGRRIEFYVAGVAVAATAIVWFYLAASFAQLVGAFMLLQLGMNIATGPYQAVIPDYVVPERAGTASAWMAALQSLGNALGVLIAALARDLRIVGAALAIVLASTCAASIVHVRTLMLQPVVAQRLRFTRAFADLFISRALIYVGFYTLLGYLFFYVAATLHAATQTQIRMLSGVLFLLFLVAGALGAVAGARPSDRFDRRAVVSIAGACFVVGLGAFLIGRNTLALYLASIVAGGAWGAFLTADWALGCAILPKSALATAMGVWNLALILPQVVAPALTTALLSAFHMLTSPAAPRAAFVFAAVEVLAGIAWVWRLPPQRASV
ncbi:MAG: MFS transporter [Vulcanimicrobiaceae bacterium]